jgi:hypothetical protein
MNSRHIWLCGTCQWQTPVQPGCVQLLYTLRTAPCPDSANETPGGSLHSPEPTSRREEAFVSHSPHRHPTARLLAHPVKAASRAIQVTSAVEPSKATGPRTPRLPAEDRNRDDIAEGVHACTISTARAPNASHAPNHRRCLPARIALRPSIIAPAPTRTPPASEPAYIAMDGASLARAAACTGQMLVTGGAVSIPRVAWKFAIAAARSVMPSNPILGGCVT